MEKQPNQKIEKLETKKIPIPEKMQEILEKESLNAERKKEFLPLITPRLEMRLPNDDDIEKILAWQHNTAVEKFAFFRREVSRGDETAYLKRKTESPTDILLVIKDKDNKEIIGTIGLHEIDFYHGNARLGILLGDPIHHGKGFGSEAINKTLEFAFGKLNLHQVYLHVLKDNEKAVSLYSKLGFNTGAILPERYKRKDGSFADFLYMYCIAPNNNIDRQWK